MANQSRDVAVRASGTFSGMAGRYALALFLEVLAFWFVLRWFLFRRAVVLIGRLLVLMMVVGALSTLGEHSYLWAACFVGAALLAWLLLRRWRGCPTPRRPSVRLPMSLVWRGTRATELAALCERRIGLSVDAAAPASIAGRAPARCLLALAGDGVWVLEDESGIRCPGIGRVVACWDRNGLVAHLEHHRRAERFELSWPWRGALVRGVMPCGAPADQLAGQLVADELARRR
jgi:hypothetical protein